MADVAGKGVSAALGASLLQGAFLGIDTRPESLRHTVERLHAFGAAGAGRIYLQVLDLDDLDHVRLLSERVLPHLA